MSEGDLEERVNDLERTCRSIPVRWAGGGAPLVLPTRLRVGRGNLVFTSGAVNIYGAKAGYSPTAVSAGMWDATLKAWIPADSTWDNGIGYAYTDAGAVVAFASKFGLTTGLLGPFTEGAIVYSGATESYTFLASPFDTVTIYIVTEF